MGNESFKKAIVIDAFPGCGKTTIGKKYANVLDFERRPFIYKEGTNAGLSIEEWKGSGIGEKNPDWPHNYLDALVKQKNNYDIILTGISAMVQSNPEFFDSFFKRNNIDFHIAMPTERSLDTIIERLRQRGNPDGFIDFVKRIYPLSADLYENGPYKKIRIEDGEFLEHALVRGGLLKLKEKEVT